MSQKRSVIAAAVIVLFGIFLGVNAGAEETPPANTYSGDFWSRSTLTGDWGGARNDLAKKGVTFDLSLTQAYQGIVDGGKKELWKYGGHGDLTIHADTQKLGLWPGGFFTVEVEGNYNKSVNGYTGALMPVNNSQMFPMPTGDNLNVPAFNFTQFLSPYFGVMFGKFATLTSTSGDMNEFAHGKGDTQFMNMAFNLNPVVATTVPYSALGAGVIILPTKNPHEAIVSFMVMQTNGLAGISGFSDLNQNLLTFVGEGRVRTNFFGLTGHQLFGAAYSNKEYASIDQNARIIIESGGLEKNKGSWNIHYNFDQYLYEPKKGSGQGIGIFGRFGASDGNPNFMHYFYSIGVGGKGIIPGRPLDQFGIGYYYLDVKNPTFTGHFATRSFLRDEQGFEAYYNFAVTPWMRLTPNIQIIRPAQKDVVSVATGGTHGISRESINTATILGTRLQLLF
ncbi:MAG: Carbohydrate-selective porin, OprB family [Syntrophorhabdus sp. PtaU1.Bin002]|nr:MAG: Carbohydrate-selective porin, OprB family [Syntrophorhabdus sp. PtaB.Bin006]OPY62952.1 MAG: Carbohydrate-selective porin, OprB family [Syntrophorhabdus sp. PtaU1.Bin002]